MNHGLHSSVVHSCIYEIFLAGKNNMFIDYQDFFSKKLEKEGWSISVRNPYTLSVSLPRESNSYIATSLDGKLGFTVDGKDYMFKNLLPKEYLMTMHCPGDESDSSYIEYVCVLFLKLKSDCTGEVLSVVPESKHTQINLEEY